MENYREWLFLGPRVMSFIERPNIQYPFLRGSFTYITALVWHIGLNAQKCPWFSCVVDFHWFCWFLLSFSSFVSSPELPWWFCALLVLGTPVIIILIPCSVRSSGCFYYSAGSLSSLCFPGSLSFTGSLSVSAWFCWFLQL